MRTHAVSTLVAAMSVAALLAQQPPAPPAPTGQPQATFESRVDFVEVHAIPTDENESFVRDLTAGDFELLEDGRPQKVEVFSLVDLPVERPFTPTFRSEPVEPDVRAAARTFDGRIYVLVLDELQTAFSRSQLVKDAARKFVEQYFGANDLGAVVYTSARQDAGQELTNSRRLLLAAIDRFQGRKLPSAGAEKLALHIRQVADTNALAEETQPVRTNEGLQRARTVRDPLDQERGANARRTLEAVRNVARWLADVQGRRKALLLFSEGIDYDIYEPFNSGEASAIVQESRDAMAAAQRANVNIYGIDPRGLAQFGELMTVGASSDYPQLEYGTNRGFMRELLLAQESLISLSQETGGLAVVNSNDVAGGLARIVLDNSRYYVLGYHSDSSRWSRKFLKIDVKVKRPGVSVRARSGFLPPDPRATERAREVDVQAGTSPALKASLSKPVPIGDLPFRVFGAAFKGSGKNASVLLALEIDGSSLRFEERDGRFNEKLEISIVAADQRAKVQGGDRQEFNLSLMPQTYERVSRTGVRLLSRLEVPPGRYQFRVGAYEATGGTLATVPYDLEVPDYAKLPLGMSGLLIASSQADSYVTPNPDPQLKDVLATSPVVARRFSRTETLTAFVEIYNATSASAHTLNVATSVLDAQDGRPVFQTQDARPAEATSSQRVDGVTAAIPLKDLKPGLYLLRVEASSSADKAMVFREVPFEVRPD
jgi:VWFA-related protein